MTSSSLVNSKNLVAKRLRQDIVSQKEIRLRERLKQGVRLREKQLVALDFLSGQLFKTATDEQLNEQQAILTDLVSKLSAIYEFSACGLMWVNSNCMLELYETSPEASDERIQTELDRLRQTGAIVRVLQNNKPALKESSEYGEWLVYHAIRTDEHVLGLLVGILPEQGMIDGALLKLFEIILRNTAYELDRLDGVNRQVADHLFRIGNDDIEQYGQRLKFISDRDRLTGLPNRENFVHHLDILTGIEEPGSLAVVSFDFDEFSRVNDTYGYAIGDQVLEEAAVRLRTKLEDTDFTDRLGGDIHALQLARIGEDEFGLIASIGEELGEVALRDCVQELLDALGKSYQLPEGDIYIGSSAGISRFPLDARESGELLIQALRARIAARKSNGKQLSVYTSSMDQSRAINSLLGERELSYGLKEKQIHVWYQPTIDLKSGDIVGAEALVRWKHPNQGLLMPGAFVPLAEATGLIGDLGEVVLRDACKLIAQADEAGFEDFRVSINLSPMQLLDSSLVDNYRAILETHQTRAERIELELTEISVSNDLERIATVLTELTDSGFQLSIDNFGKGKTSLAMLRSLPVKLLKIDQTFIQGLQQDKANKAIIHALVAMGQDLDMKILAEGVESEEQLNSVRDLGCDQVQGFYLARPSNPASFEELMAEWKSAATLEA